MDGFDKGLVCGFVVAFLFFFSVGLILSPQLLHENDKLVGIQHKGKVYRVLPLDLSQEKP